MLSPALPARPAVVRLGEPPAPARAASVLVPLASLFSVCVAFVLTYWAFVLTARGQWVDEQALVGAKSYLAANAAQAASLSWLNRLPEVVGVACAVGLAVSAWLRRDLVVPLLAAASAGGAMLATQLLKHSVLTRPNLGISEAWGNSFPSGHTTAAAAATVALVLAAPRQARPALSLLGALASAFTGAATVIMGWHRPSDVVAAFLVCAAFGLLSSLIIGGVRRARGSAGATRAAAGWISWAAPLCGLVLVGVAALLAGPGIAAAGAAGSGDLGPYVWAGLAFIGGSALLIFPLTELVSRRWLG